MRPDSPMAEVAAQRALRAGFGSPREGAPEATAETMGLSVEICEETGKAQVFLDFAVRGGVVRYPITRQVVKRLKIEFDHIVKLGVASKRVFSSAMKAP